MIFLQLRTFFVICLILTFSEIFGQEKLAGSPVSSGLQPRHITTANGLPSNIITGITKDDKGFIWISTNKGFCKWDGFNSLVFQHIPSDTNSLSADDIPRNAFLWDKQRNQLVIGHLKGLSFFNPETADFVNLEINPDKKNSLPGPVNAVFKDNTGLIWIGTDNGFCSINKNNRISFRYTYQDKLPEGVFLDPGNINKVHDICQDVNNNDILWLATLGGILKFNKTSNLLEWFYYPDQLYLRELNQFNMSIPLENGEICLGTWNFDLLFFDTKKDSFSRRIGQNAAGKFKTTERLTPYLPVTGSKVWVSSLEGLGILDPVSGEIIRYAEFKNQGGFRLAPELFLLDDNNLWLGSENGIYVFKSQNQAVHNFIFKPKDENHWYLTRAMMEIQQKDQILIGYGRGEGLHFFDLRKGAFFIQELPDKRISENTVSAFLPLMRTEILFLERNHMYNYNPATGRIELMNISRNGSPILNDIKRDKNGNIWLASNNMGLQQFNLDQMKVQDILNWSETLGSGFELPNFNELFADNYGHIWFRRKGGSYGYYEPGKKAVTYFEEPNHFLDISSFGNRKGDTVWVAAVKKGIGFIDTRSPDAGVQFVYSLDSLPVKFISDILSDHKNRLWCLTESGLLRLNPRGNDYFLFDENHGVIVHDSWSDKNNLLPGKLLLLEDGRIAMGYRHGLGIFDPDSINASVSIPKPFLTSFKINGENSEIHISEKVSFAHDQNNLSFTYSALDLYQKGIILKHKLAGLDQDWADAEPGRDNYYPNLSPGRYTLLIKAMSLKGQGTPEQLNFLIKIQPPWWQTLWGYLLFVLLIVSSTIFLYRLQVKRQLAHRETKRLRELDELKTKLYANITHEFRTPITVIMGVASDLSQGTEYLNKKSLQNKVETIQRNSGNLLHLVNQMLDLAKLEAGKMIYQPIRSNIIAWLQYIVESHHSLAEAKGIQLTFYAETPVLEMDYDPNQLSKVVTNLLTNAIKFTGKKGKVIFHVKFDSRNNQLHIKVKDNGIGIPAAELDRIFDRFYQVESAERAQYTGTGIGLSLSREIVEMIGGQIHALSTTGQGSEFDLLLPVTRNAKVVSNMRQNFDKSFLQNILPQSELEDEDPAAEHDPERAFILVAEDNQDVAGYIRDTIRNQYRVKWAPDGVKALELAVEYIPDLIITDVMMPVKDGYALCNDLKTNPETDHIPVIMLTARVTDSDRITGYEKGADAYLTKPFNKKELLVRIEQLLKLRRQLQEKYSRLEVPANNNNTPPGPEEQFILKAVTIIEKNFEKSTFHAADLAVEVHLSESQLYRKLKAITGKSSALFIRTVRLKKAKEMLENSGFSISEIAYQVGFNDPAWFSRAFKEEFGKTPSDSRKR